MASETGDHPAMKGYKNAIFETDQVFIKVGVSSKYWPMQTRQVSILGVRSTFTLVNTRSEWLHKSICGSAAGGRSSLNRIGLLKDLHDAVQKAMEGEDEGDEEVYDVVDVDDPMNDIDAPAVETPIKTRGRGAKRKRTNTGRGKVVTVQLPLEPPEVNPFCIETRTARLYVQHSSQIWLHIDDVNWAVKYMYAQYVLKGVAHVSPDDAGPSAADTMH